MKNVDLNRRITVEKCVGEYNVFETNKTPYGKFKVKIYERENGQYIGYTNLLLKDNDGCPVCGVGHGETVDGTLKDTIEYFFKMIDEKEKISDLDFEVSDPYDF